MPATFVISHNMMNLYNFQPCQFWASFVFRPNFVLVIFSERARAFQYILGTSIRESYKTTLKTYFVLFLFSSILRIMDNNNFFACALGAFIIFVCWFFFFVCVCVWLCVFVFCWVFFIGFFFFFFAVRVCVCGSRRKDMDFFEVGHCFCSFGGS